MIPKKLVRRIVKKEVNEAHVTAEAITYLQLHLENELKTICQKAVVEQNRVNQRYKQVGIPQKKRFGIYVFKHIVERHNNPPTDKNPGVGRQHDRDIPISEGVDMKDTKKITPSWQEKVV
ncbi:MAG: hypothetical protein IMZ64_05765 [Bacteroidetes bacterium]|nr:hypothetical protein [Bacteroidota bacterium]